MAIKMIGKLSLLMLIGILAVSCKNDSKDKIATGFKDPPSYTKPWVYWYWIDENISKEGITRDLEAMADEGIGEALIGHVSPGDKRGDVKILSKEWWDMVAFAVSEGQRVGVNIGFFNGPGWSQSGGPWIKADESMRYLVSNETKVTGPAKFHSKIPDPGDHFQRVALQAIPDHAYDHQRIPAPVKIQAEPGWKNAKDLFDGDTASYSYIPLQENSGDLILDLKYARQTTIRSITFNTLPVPFEANVEIQSPGKNGNYKTDREFVIDHRNINFQIGPERYGPVSFSIPRVFSDRIRLVFTILSANRGAGFREIIFSDKPVVDDVTDKELGKMYSQPLPPWDAYLWPEQTEPADSLTIKTAKIIDLSGRIDSSGMLTWNVPAGNWTILNTGMVPTGAVNVPAPPEATGYECDKFSRRAIETHFNAFIGKFLESVLAARRKSLKTVVIDSYEVGPQNWTDSMRAIFIDRLGYDPLPWLPVLTGRIVENADLSNRFLWDLRRLTADLIAENYVGGLRDLSNRYGLKLWLENYGHWGFPAEFLQYGGQSDYVSGEFWYRNPYWDLGPLECRAASSAAHIYGKKQIFAEAFTAGFNFTQYPGAMKSRGDKMFCEGINHFVMHVYIHQPWTDRKPGVTAWFGMSFNRNNTWFKQGKAWIDYIRRCEYLLQQGEPVSDLCYFIGDDAPKMTGILDPGLPAGYDYDFINSAVLLKATSVNGFISLPDGKKYKLLVLPPLKTMRPEVLQKIGKLISDGARVYGPPPAGSPSLAGYPDNDKEVRELAAKIWGNSESVTTDRKYGSGKIYNKTDFKSLLLSLNIEPDVICADTGILWTHRVTPDMDIYFISNQHDHNVATQISFRIKNKIPECWDAVDGTVRGSDWFRSEKDRTIVPVELSQGGSVFIVFMEKSDVKNIEGIPRKGIEILPAIVPVKPWKIFFPSGWDAPDSIRTDTLKSWTEFDQEGIKYFSGTATYKNSFSVPENYPSSGVRLKLTLGTVNMLAEVIVNGKNAGVIWCRPFEKDITEFVKPGINKLEIKITNTWWNRLIGDAKYPDGFPGSDYHQPRTFATVKNWSANEELLPSGLLGPVEIEAVSMISIEKQ